MDIFFIKPLYCTVLCLVIKQSSMYPDLLRRAEEWFSHTTQFKI